MSEPDPPPSPDVTAAQPVAAPAPAPATPAAPSLAQRILRETSLFAVLQTVGALLAALAAMLLARLLDRRDFGVYGICTFYIGIGTLLGDGGLGAALLRRKAEPTRDELRTTLTSLLVVASALALTLMLAAPWVGRHNHLTPGETRVLRAMAPLYLLGALRVVPYIKLERELLFSRIARIELSASLVRHVLAITVAVFKGGVWALVVSNLASASLQLLLAYRAKPGWVGLGWSFRVFRPLISYGGQVQALGICAYLKDNISRALLGGALGPAAVGLFDFGLQYIQIPVVAVNALARVQFPVYARLAAHDPDLYTVVRGALRASLVLGIPALCVLALGAPWIVPTIYSARWLGATPVVWGLLANMVGGLLASPLFTLLQGQGRPRLAIGVFLAWTVTTWALAITAVVVLPGKLGFVALAHSVVTVAVVAGMAAWAGRHLRRGLFGALAGPVLAGLAALGAAAFALWRGRGALGHPLAAVGVYLVVYTLALGAIEGRQVLEELRGIARAVLGRGSKADAGAAGAVGSDVPKAA